MTDSAATGPANGVHAPLMDLKSVKATSDQTWRQIETIVATQNRQIQELRGAIDTLTASEQSLQQRNSILKGKLEGVEVTARRLEESHRRQLDHGRRMYCALKKDHDALKAEHEQMVADHKRHEEGWRSFKAWWLSKVNSNRKNADEQCTPRTIRKGSSSSTSDQRDGDMSAHVKQTARQLKEVNEAATSRQSTSTSSKRKESLSSADRKMLRHFGLDPTQVGCSGPFFVPTSMDGVDVLQGPDEARITNLTDHSPEGHGDGCQQWAMASPCVKPMSPAKPVTPSYEVLQSTPVNVTVRSRTHTDARQSAGGREKKKVAASEVTPARSLPQDADDVDKPQHLRTSLSKDPHSEQRKKSPTRSKDEHRADGSIPSPLPEAARQGRDRRLPNDQEDVEPEHIKIGVSAVRAASPKSAVVATLGPPPEDHSEEARKSTRTPRTSSATVSVPHDAIDRPILDEITRNVSPLPKTSSFIDLELDPAAFAKVDKDGPESSPARKRIKLDIADAQQQKEELRRQRREKRGEEVEELARNPNKFKGNGRYANELRGATRTINQDFEIDPAQNGGVAFPHKEVIRGKQARKSLHAYDCHCCAAWYEAVGPHARPEDRQAQLQQTSRHRAYGPPASTPEGYWRIEFPESAEAEKINAQAEEQRRNKRAQIERDPRFRERIR
ncbi:RETINOBLASTOMA BINDING PROTEIN 8 [Ceraceosorus bombacis]|uniref:RETINOBLASTOMA BINDING PROTEIN 8 n=1 Tax=Ceraceosorus bombacis TaxID=401625 RepID=A0A0P1BIB2_9BASI|nr:RETINOBLASTOMA BINDING PROTEIN 8 [Ceraceosorus bombacis]